MFGRRERSSPYQRDPITNLEDLRDDCIAIFMNSDMTMKAVHEAGGPTPQTISKWLYKETRFPRMDSIRAFLQALGYDYVIMPRIKAQRYREQHSFGNVTMFRPRKAASR